MKLRTGLFLLGSLLFACEDNSPDAPLVYAPEQIERLLLANGESTSWVKEGNTSCSAFTELNFQPFDSLSQVILLQTHTSTPCAELDTFYVSFVDVQGTVTTNLLQLVQEGDSTTYTLNLLTSQILELRGPFGEDQGDQLYRYLRTN